MSNKNPIDKFELMNSKQLIKWILWIFLSAVTAILVVLLLYTFKFNGFFSSDHERWGTFGDFFGGTLNPVLSFFALTALLLTIVLQNRELEATREEMSQSRAASQEQVAHLKNESKKADVYRTIQVLESRLEKLYREPIHFISGNKMRQRELVVVKKKWTPI